MLLGILLLCFLGTFYSPKFGGDTDSALDGPTGLTCWWNKSSRVQGGKKTRQNTKRLEQRGGERLGLLGILCVTFLEVTQVHWNESCKDRPSVSQWTVGLGQLHCSDVKLLCHSQCRFGLGFFSTYSCGPRSFRSLVCVDRMSLSTHCQAEVGKKKKKK